ncbi:hypothetical protein ACTFIY_010704 [Dictyostelium cf. discoideum]
MCKLPDIPHTSDNGSHQVNLFAQILLNNVVIDSYNETFSKGTRSTFFGEINKMSVYNSGEYLQIRYKTANGLSKRIFNQDCYYKDKIPIKSNSVVTLNGGHWSMAVVTDFKFKLTLTME